jgi:hypothetical protein
VRGPRYGLVAASPTAIDGTQEDDSLRWPNGIEFQAEACAEAGLGLIACNGGTMTPGDDGEIVTADAFFLYASDRCSTLGSRTRDWKGRAKRRLQAGQSYALALELWDGAATQASIESDNLWLAGPAADSDEVTDGPTASVKALACLVQAVGSFLFGGQGMIHMTTQMLTILASMQAVRLDGGIWTTPMGHIVVADAGYSGSGPDGVPAGASQWMYGTPMIDVKLGPIDHPGQPDTVESVAVATNLQTVWAQRVALLQWEQTCGIAAAEVDIPACAIGGVS